MNILLAKPAQDELKLRHEQSLGMGDVISVLESFDMKKMDSDIRIRKIPSAEEDIFVLKDRGMRVYFIKRETDIVVLSIENL